MRTRVYWKIAGTHLLAAAITLGVLGTYLVLMVRNDARASLREEVRTQAILARECVRAHVTSGRAQTDLSELAIRLAGTTDSRITLIAADGQVLADSEHDPTTMGPHKSRPEVRAARRDGFGSAARRSDTLGIDFLYVALPLDPANPGGAVLRLAVPMTKVAAAGSHVRGAILIGLLLAIALVIGLSLWLARGIGRPIDELRRTAVALAAGDLSRRARVDTADEIQRLAETFNNMADRLVATLNELGEAKARSEAILASMADGVIVADAHGIVTLFNGASEELLGIARQEAIGCSVHEAALHFELGEMVARCLATGTTEHGEIRIDRPAARVLDAVVTAIADESGGPCGAVVVLHDLTELRRLEDVRREFVGNVSHELRTPVAAVRSLVETLSAASADDPEAARRFLEDLEHQTVRLTALLDDLLELSRLDSGRREIMRKPVDVASIVRAATRKFAPRVQANGQTLHTHVPEGITVLGNAHALERVVVNILDNAIKYAGEGGVITITGSVEEERVLIEVSDNGPGIPEADQPRIFERFYRVDRARSRELGGTGLGLSIVKHIVEAHGGDVNVESELGEGSTFRVRLARVRETPAPD